MTFVARRAYASRAEADRVRRALTADNQGFVDLAVEGRSLVVRARADGPARLRATLDDLLACVRVAERTAGID